MAKTFLDKAYGLDSAEDTQAFYAQWAETYDAEVGQHGYATPARLARAMAGVMPSDIALLDFGCGTGLSGLALRAAGFQRITGCDVSREMIAHSSARGVYDEMHHIAIGDVPTGFEAIAAIGVIGAGAAPIETFDLLMDALPQGGFFAFSFNDHALEDAAFAGKVEDYLRARKIIVRYQDYGDHLPGIDLNSMIYVVEKK